MSYPVYSDSMGRTLPSIIQIVFSQIAELGPLYGALRRSDQLILDEFFEAVLQHRHAIGNASSLLPMEVLPLIVLLEERKRANHLFQELYGRIDELEKRLRRLESNENRE